MFFQVFCLFQHILLDLFSLSSAKNIHWVRWKSEQSFDGKLCPEYSYQKLSKSDIRFQVTVENVRDAFLGHSV